MNSPKLIPTGSQTVGPYFRIRMKYLIGQGQADNPASDTIEIRGKVLDSDAAPVFGCNA